MKLKDITFAVMCAFETSSYKLIERLEKACILNSKKKRDPSFCQDSSKGVCVVMSLVDTMPKQ